MKRTFLVITILCLGSVLSSLPTVADEVRASQCVSVETMLAIIDGAARQLDNDLPSREFLTSTEGEQFDRLVLNARPDAGDRQLESLVKVGMERRTRFLSLNGKTNLSTNERQEIEFLQSLLRANLGQLRELSSVLALRFQQLRDKAQAKNEAESELHGWKWFEIQSQ